MRSNWSRSNFRSPVIGGRSEGQRCSNSARHASPASRRPLLLRVSDAGAGARYCEHGRHPINHLRPFANEFIQLRRLGTSASPPSIYGATGYAPVHSAIRRELLSFGRAVDGLRTTGDPDAVQPSDMQTTPSMPEVLCTIRSCDHPINYFDSVLILPREHACPTAPGSSCPTSACRSVRPHDEAVQNGPLPVFSDTRLSYHCLFPVLHELR